MTVKTLIPLLSLLLVTAAGCGGEPEPKAAPDLRGERLDVAEQRLDELGLEYERVGGGALGIVVRSRDGPSAGKDPPPGRRTTEVRLIVDRWCPPPPTTRVVPALVGMRLAAATPRLERLDLAYSVSSLDDGPAPPSLDGLRPVPGRRLGRAR